MLVAKRLTQFQYDLEASQLYDRWYKTIIDCSLQAGCTIIDLNGKCNKMELKSGRIVCYKHRRTRINLVISLGETRNAKKRSITGGIVTRTFLSIQINYIWSNIEKPRIKLGILSNRGKKIIFYKLSIDKKK